MSSLLLVLLTLVACCATAHGYHRQQFIHSHGFSSSVPPSFTRRLSPPPHPLSSSSADKQFPVRLCSFIRPVSPSSYSSASFAAVPLVSGVVPLQSPRRVKLHATSTLLRPLASLAAVSSASEAPYTGNEAFQQAAIKVLAVLNSYKGKGKISDTSVDIFAGFVKDYARECAKSGRMTADEFIDITTSFINIAETTTEFPFSAYHKAVRKPFDFYDWGNRFWRPLIDMDHSRLLGKESLQQISEQLEKGENVVLFSNHQIEPDPQVMRLVFQQMGFEGLGEQLVMVAGYRVRTDPLSIPFSLGCNLLCVHSKKHMESVPDLKEIRQTENLQTMRAMQSLLFEGGKLIWVAPSGGRDRAADSEGGHEQFAVAPFDSKTVQMFRLMGKKSGRQTHFFPMALRTAAICPPPPKVERSLGESRTCAFSAVGVAVGAELANLSSLKAAEFSAIAQQQTESLYAGIQARN
eukprot:GHVS01074442.1.p1 GENE.GHVS01074442.1~~GHVS01074442.1.p1  ORF type:complete len:482 (-),score=96.44 GHVS01074442.1:328-1719(-)